MWAGPEQWLTLGARIVSKRVCVFAAAVQVRHMLSSHGRLHEVTQVILNPSEEPYFNVISTMSNREDIKVGLACWQRILGLACGTGFMGWLAGSKLQGQRVEVHG
jgi:hypothetical protein